MQRKLGPGAQVLVPGSGMDFLKPENRVERQGQQKGAERDNLRLVACEAHGEGVSRPRSHLFDMVLVLRAGCECRYPPGSRLYRSVEGLKVENLIRLFISLDINCFRAC